MKLPLWVVNLICLSGVRTGGVGMLHIGQLIACTLHEQGRTVTWFARQLCCTRPNVYKIFGKENIDISMGRRTKRFFNSEGENGGSCLFIGSYGRMTETA